MRGRIPPLIMAPEHEAAGQPPPFPVGNTEAVACFPFGGSPPPRTLNEVAAGMPVGRG